MQPISPLANLIYRKLCTRMPFISSYDEETVMNIISKLFQPLGNEFCEVLYRDETFSIENMFCCYDMLVVSKNISREYIESYSKLHLKYCPIGDFNTYDYVVIKNNNISYCLKEDIYMTIPKGESFYFALQNMLRFNLSHVYPKILIDPKIERWAFKFIEKWDATEELALYPLNMTKIYITLG